MIKSMGKPLILTLLCFAAACAPGGGGGGKSKGNSPDGKPSGPFASMTMQTKGSCENPDEIRFVNNVNLTAVKIGNQGGKDIVVNLLLQLLADGNYFLVYSEEMVVSQSEDSVEYDPVFFQNVEGKWIADGEKLTLEGLGVARLLKVGADQHLQLKIQTRINDPAAMSPSFVLTPALIPLGPKGETPHGFCQGQ